MLLTPPTGLAIPPAGTQLGQWSPLSMPTTCVHIDAVLIVKVPKTDEYKALQPKKVEIT